jgi:mannitol-1-/sugar-/sorbitol-6-phosphatase
MQTLRCAAVLFDFDGVIVDSTAAVARQYTRWALEYDLDPEAILRTAHGVRTEEVIRQAAPHLDALEETIKIERREAEDSGVRIMPGAVDLLNSIPHSKWGIVTSGRRALVSARLQRLSIPAPSVLVTAEDVTQGKPAPDPYLKGAALLGVKPAKCVVVEDAVAGIRAAHAAGMRVISLPSTYDASSLAEADVIVPALSQIRVSLDGAGPHGDLILHLD